MPVSKLRRSGRVRQPPEPTPLAPPLSDAELSERLAHGDRWAEEAVYRKYIQVVWGVALRLMGNRADAEDVVIKTFAEALRDPQEARDRHMLRGWLVGVAVHQMRRTFRWRRLSLDRSQRAHILDEHAARGLDPALAGALQKLDRLTPRRRIAWCLRYIEGCSPDEVAAYCACSLATAEREIGAAHAAMPGQLEIALLSTPLKALLDEPISELQVLDIWRKVQAPVSPRWSRRQLPLAAAGILLGAGVVVAGFLVLRTPPPGTASTRVTRHSRAATPSEPAYMPHDGTQLTAAQATLLMHEAEQALQRRDEIRAGSLLERVRRGASGSPHAALAGWRLAGMRMSSDPARAALDIQRALQDKLPEPLHETVRARLVEAHARAGASAAARAAAHAYRAAYPQGRYLAEVERWTHTP